MNVHEAIKVLLKVSGIDGAYTFRPAERRVTIIAAQSVAAEIISKYDALAPDWANAPDDAEWYTIDVEGDCAWHSDEPTICGHGWYSPEKYIVNGIDLPDHIDWRDCKWSREGAK